MWLLVLGVLAVRLANSYARGAKIRFLEQKTENIAPDFAAWLTSIDAEVICGNHEPEHFADAVAVNPSPGVPCASLLSFLPADGSVELWQKWNLHGVLWKAKRAQSIIAVTGTSGKATTVSLCAAMLEARVKVF